MVSVWMYKMYTHFQYLYYSSTYAYLCRYVCPTLKAIDTSSLRLTRLKKRDPYSPCKIRDLFPAAIYPSSITIPQSPVTIYMSIFYDLGRYQVSRYLQNPHIYPHPKPQPPRDLYPRNADPSYQDSAYLSIWRQIEPTFSMSKNSRHHHSKDLRGNNVCTE